MATSATRISATLGLLFTTALALAGCGGGGGGGHASTPAANATVRGHVAAVNGGSAASVEGGASADTISCTGIVVRAERDGEEVAVTTTTATCDFELPVPGGDVTLVFVVDGFTVTTTITVPPGSVLVIVVILEPGGVVINDREVHGTIHCENGDVHIDDRGAALVIDGGGGDCIRADDHCTVTIDADTIALRHCASCIHVAGGADVQLTTAVGDLTCDAGEDGIDANGNASVHLGSAAGVAIVAGEDGIDAAGTPDVVVDAVGVCTIDGGENAISRAGAATVDVGSCALTGGTSDHGNGNGNHDKGDNEGDDQDD